MPDAPAHLLLVLSAPSGAGKTTVCQNLLAADPGVVRAITCTTRPPRPGEQDGADYYFLAPDVFQAKVAAGEFLEHALVHGHLYGTLKAEALGRLRQGRDVLLNIDVQGAENVRRQAGQNPELRRALVSIFLAPPSLEVLAQRLRQRAQDAPEVIARRLEAARAEFAHWPRFDYLVVSGTMDEDLQRVQAIVIAERLRQHRAQPPTL